ncbi:hypothetical protein AGMMS4952_24060 [Spirochaetia bacterium]|nr:hypothetical protein AGMMS4952_24060 [Spirochaetia bacterium]
MKYNDAYNQRYEKIKDTIALKNKHVTTSFMATATAGVNEGLTVAEYMDNPETSLKAFDKYINRLLEYGPIDSQQF